MNCIASDRLPCARAGNSVSGKMHPKHQIGERFESERLLPAPFANRPTILERRIQTLSCATLRLQSHCSKLELRSCKWTNMINKRSPLRVAVYQAPASLSADNHGCGKRSKRSGLRRSDSTAACIVTEKPEKANRIIFIIFNC